MATSTTISQLPNGVVLTGIELVPMVQNGVTIKATTAQIAALGGGGGGGIGTVTSVNVADNHGFVGTVANATTTPNISIQVSSGVGVGLLKTDGTNMLRANPGFDYLIPGLVENSGLTSNTARIVGRTTAGVGALEEITIGSGLTLSGGTLVATSSGGSVTTLSVVSANGLAGTVANATTTPAITLTTSITGVLKGNGTAISAAAAATDYVAPGATTTSGLTMATARMLGRTTASTGAIEEITMGSGLSLSGGTLSVTSSGGSVTTVSVVSANGFAGTVATATSTPAITLTTSITGLLKGNGTAISAATAGTDYYVPGGALGTPSSGVATNLTSIPAGQLTGNLVIGRFNSGSSASSTTFWRGDGVWAVPGSSTPPNEATFRAGIQAALLAGQCYDWPFGNMTLTSPLSISTGGNNSQGFGLDMHGAHLICGFSNTSADLLTVLMPNALTPFAAISGSSIRNVMFLGNGNCRHGLVLRAQGSGVIYQGNVTNCFFASFVGSGCQLFGDMGGAGVFEYDIISCYVINCRIGLDMHCGTGAPGAGISSIKITNGDYRQCSYAGIATTADIAFTEGTGIQITAVDFINNGGCACFMGAGGTRFWACHFEFNARNSPPAPAHVGCNFAGIAVSMIYCDGDNGDVPGAQYLLQIAGIANATFIDCSNSLEGSGTFAKLAKLSGGTVTVDRNSGGASGLFDGSGMTVFTANYTTSSF